MQWLLDSLKVEENIKVNFFKSKSVIICDNPFRFSIFSPFANELRWYGIRHVIAITTDFAQTG